MYKIRPFFEKYQEELRSFANTPYGRDFISGFGGKELKENYPVIKVTPDGVHQLLGGDKKGNYVYRAVFYPRSPYVAKFAEVLTYIDIAKENGFNTNKKELVIPHFLGETRLLKDFPNRNDIYLASSETFNPDADTESTSVDGEALRSGVNETISIIRAGAGTASNDSTASRSCGRLRASATTNWFQDLARGIYLFDTSDLPDDAIKDSAVFSLTPSLLVDGMNGGGSSNSRRNLVASTPASNIALQDSDYGQTGSTSFGTSPIQDDLSVDSEFDITLNASGLSAISLTSVTKFATRTGWDLNNTITGLTWTSGQFARVAAYNADNGTNIPKLVVTYTVPSGFFAIL